jgi:hypothetical protein
MLEISLLVASSALEANASVLSALIDITQKKTKK